MCSDWSWCSNVLISCNFFVSIGGSLWWLDSLMYWFTWSSIIQPGSLRLQQETFVLNWCEHRRKPRLMVNDILCSFKIAHTCSSQLIEVKIIENLELKHQLMAEVLMTGLDGGLHVDWHQLSAMKLTDWRLSQTQTQLSSMLNVESFPPMSVMPDPLHQWIEIKPKKKKKNWY